MTEQIDFAANRVHYRGNILKLALDGITFSLATLATSTSVNGENGKVFL
jgi:hypothetical protein